MHNPRRKGKFYGNRESDFVRADSAAGDALPVSDAIYGFHAQQAAEKLLKALLWDAGAEDCVMT